MKQRVPTLALAVGLALGLVPALAGCAQSYDCLDGLGQVSLTGVAWDRTNELVYLRLLHPQSYCTSNPEEVPYIHELITVHLADGTVDFDARSSRSFAGDPFPDDVGVWPLWDDGGQPGARLCSVCDITIAPPPDGTNGELPPFELRVRDPMSLVPTSTGAEGAAAPPTEVGPSEAALREALRAFIIVRGDDTVVTLLSDYTGTRVYDP